MGDFKNLCAIESRLGHIINRKEIEGFHVRKTVPVSILNYVPKKKKQANQSNNKTSKGAGKNTKKRPEKTTHKNKIQEKSNVNQHIWGK